MKTSALLLAAGLLLACDDNPSGRDKKDAGRDQPDAEPFALEVAPEDLVELSLNGEAVRAAPDLVLVGLAADQYDSDADSVADLAGGAVVGRLPALGLLQIQLSASGQASLDAAITALREDARVAFAGYDLELTTSEGACPVENDNARLAAEFRCFYQDIEADTAMTVLKHLEPSLRYSPVKLGLVDTGLNTDHPEFDDVVIVDAHGVEGQRTDLMQDPNGHGTRVAAMLVADDDNMGVAGLASSALGDALTLIFGKMTGQLFPTIISLHRVLHAGAQVVNMSFGVNRDLGNRELMFEWAGFSRLFDAWPDALFVAAAPNRPFTLTGTNHMPGGMPAPNLITVGGTKACAITAPYDNSARGSASVIQIAAPAQGVVSIDPTIGDLLELKSGNSIATPQVSAVAAILYALAPDLTPTEARVDYIQGMSNFGPAEVGGRVLTVPYVVGQLLLDRVGGGAVREVLDANGDGYIDTTNTMYQSVCGGESRYSVDGQDSFTAASTDQAIGGGNLSAFNLAFVHEPYSFGISCNDCLFDLGVFPIVPGEAMAEDTAIATYSWVGGNTVVQGQGQGGALTVNACRITGRVNEPQTASIIYEVQVEGRFGGDMEITTTTLDPLSVETDQTTFSGAFKMPWLFNASSETDDLALQLERKCANGRTPPDSPATALLAEPELEARWGVSRAGSDARLNGMATRLAAAQAVAWTHQETPPSGSGLALHLALVAAEGPAAVGDSVTLDVVQPDCSGQTEPACVQAGGVAIGLYSWAAGVATRSLQGVSGQVTLERSSSQVLRATLDVHFDDSSEAQGWTLRLIE